MRWVATCGTAWFPRIPSVRGRPRPYHWNDLSDEKDEEFSDGRLCVGRGSVARRLVLATHRPPFEGSRTRSLPRHPDGPRRTLPPIQLGGEPEYSHNGRR